MLETTSSCAPISTLNLAPMSSPSDHNINQSNMSSTGYINQVTSFSSSTPPPAHHHHHHQIAHNRSVTNSLLNLLQFSHEKDSNSGLDNQVAGEINSRNIDHHDEYGFLWDMTFQDENNNHNNSNHLENEVATSDLDEMRFDIDDNSMVFL